VSISACIAKSVKIYLCSGLELKVCLTGLGDMVEVSKNGETRAFLRSVSGAVMSVAFPE
jgi:hypothetical protein